MRKILVVDDDRAVLEMTAALLEYAGYEVIAVDSGRRALAHLAAESPDLVVLDYAMPEMDGCEVLWRMRQNASTRDLPVLLVSASPRPNLRGLSRCIFLPKPFDLERLVASVERVMDGSLTAA